uniref:30S ribosomal protein S9, chloroplastic n=1 Tax=Aplanochytrium stocchinoi TaxID=215587 RepID=A0A7S3UZY6_9STRA|mmetsp:Transcript_13178/g.15211  ORF Transcript_13178/g.15211 Transcript_13178/m.15211 type:complete len:289 (+) Transcript_13178:107-973(+)
MRSHVRKLSLGVFSQLTKVRHQVVGVNVNTDSVNKTSFWRVHNCANVAVNHQKWITSSARIGKRFLCTNRNDTEDSDLHGTDKYLTYNPLDDLKDDQVYDMSDFEDWQKAWKAMGATDKTVRFDEDGNMVVEDILSGKVRLEEAMRKPLDEVTSFEGKGGETVGYGVGRRKNSSARVWISVGTGKFTVNSKTVNEYFDTEWWLKHTIEPLHVTHSLTSLDVNARVFGGGKTGQAGAIRLGLSRALQRANPDLRWVLKKEKMLRRDPRMVERKKPGQKKARKKFQWVKR